MKKIHLIAALLFSVGLLSSGAALADHGHFRGGIGIYVGPGFGPYYPGPYYPYPYYGPYGYPYSPPVIVTPAPVVQSPPVYIEQQTQQQPAVNQSNIPADYYWYHCDQPEGYYPYIKECPKGWTKVTPQPPK